MASWVANAKTLQEDILRSKTLADDIVRQADAPDVSGKDIRDAEDKVDFIRRELRYSAQLLDVLHGIDHVNQLLGEVEAATNERRILDSLHLLESMAPIPSGEPTWLTCLGRGVDGAGSSWRQQELPRHEAAGPPHL